MQQDQEEEKEQIMDELDEVISKRFDLDNMSCADSGVYEGEEEIFEVDPLQI